MNIEVLSKLNFDRIIKLYGISDDNVESQAKDSCFISIFGYSGKSIFNFNHENVLLLQFDDICTDLNPEKDPDYFGAIAFNREHAKAILEFMEKNKDKKNCIIHCAAGISRSGAAGIFLNDIYGIPYFNFMEKNNQLQPNVLVTSILKQTYYESL